MRIEKRQSLKIEFFNEITGRTVEDISELTDDEFGFLILIPHRAIVESLSKRDIVSGCKRGFVKRKYELTDGQMRSVLEKLGIYKPKHRRKFVLMDIPPNN